MTKRLHILFLSSWYPSRVFPTNGDFVQRHAEAVSTKHQVSVVHVVTDPLLKQKTFISDETINDVRTIIIYIKSTNILSKMMLFYRAYMNALKQIGHFDMVHLNVTYPVGILAFYLKRFWRKPYIVTEHWTNYQYPLNKMIGPTRKWLTKLIIKNASFVCPVSNHLGSAMLEYGLKAEYVRVPNIVDTNHFVPSKNTSTRFTISHISHMGNEHKNVIGILRAIAEIQNQIPSLHTNLIGSNSMQYQEYIDELGILNIDVIDQIPNTEVPTYLNESDVLILFSNFENLPCIILEAFSCGTPVISTDVGGIKEYFPAEFGFLIEPKNEQALQDAILRVFHNKTKVDRDNMHQYAVDHFSVERISEQFSTLYLQSLQLEKV